MVEFQKCVLPKEVHKDSKNRILKRLGKIKNEREICSSDFSKLARNMVVKMIDQVKEGIIDQLLIKWTLGYSDYTEEAF